MSILLSTLKYSFNHCIIICSFHNVQFHGFSSAIMSTYHKHATPPSPYRHSLETNLSSLSFTQCSFIHQTNQSLCITDQPLALDDCVFEGLYSHSHSHSSSRWRTHNPSNNCAVEFAVRFTKSCAKLYRCQIHCFNVGYKGEGTSVLQDCSIKRCEQTGVIFSSSSSSPSSSPPLLLQITGGEIGRCLEGVVADQSIVSLSHVHLFHCYFHAISCTHCLTVRMHALCIHDCRECGVLVTSGDCLICSDCSLYNGGGRS